MNDLRDQINKAYIDAERIKIARAIQAEQQKQTICKFFLPCGICERSGKQCHNYL